MEWVQNERFIELYGEGHRHYDVRRWMIAPEVLKEGVREGLNAETIVNPTFEEFNQRIKVDQPYRCEYPACILLLFCKAKSEKIQIWCKHRDTKNNRI